MFYILALVIAVIIGGVGGHYTAQINFWLWLVWTAFCFPLGYIFGSIGTELDRRW